MPAAQAAGSAWTGKGDLVFQLPGKVIDISTRGDVLQIFCKDLAASGSDVFQRLRLFRQYRRPRAFRGIVEINGNQFPVRRILVRLHEKLVADVIDDIKLIVGDFGNDALPLFVVLLRIAPKHGVALFPLTAVLDIQNCEAFVFCGFHRVKPLRICFVRIDELILRLRCAHAVVVNLVIVILRRQLVALFRRVVPAVVKATALPGQIRDLDPMEDIVQHLS